MCPHLIQILNYIYWTIYLKVILIALKLKCCCSTVENAEPHGISELMRKILQDKNVGVICCCFLVCTMQPRGGCPFHLLSPCLGQAGDTIRLIIELALITLLLPWWLMILQSLEPPGAKNAHLSDVHSVVEVKWTLKSQTTNAYYSVLL